jgi:hypothetical protein
LWPRIARGRDPKAVRRGLVPAIVVAVAVVTDAVAQFAPPLPKLPCHDHLMPLREDAQKRVAAIVAAGKRKAESNEICQLLGHFAEAEAKVIRFVEEQGASCGISPEALSQMKQSQSKTGELRKRVCAGPSPPASPRKIWTPVSPPNIWMSPPASPPPKRIRIAAFSPDFAG